MYPWHSITAKPARAHMNAIPICSVCAAYSAQQFLFPVRYVRGQILELPLEQLCPPVSFTDNPKTSSMDDPKRIAGVRVAGVGQEEKF